MSIREIVQANLGHRLFNLEALIPSDEFVRTLLVSQEVLDAVDGPLPENWDGQRHADQRQTLDAFIAGEYITVSDDPIKKPNNCFMSRVAPADAQVVDIRSLLGAGIRTFGFVLEYDCFAALTWDYREQTDFDYEVKRCLHEWKQLFGALSPYSKERLLHECFTKAVAV